MGTQQINHHIETYVNRLKENIKPSQVILFGSFLDGSYTDGSDIDLIVVSDHFSKVDGDERLRMLYRETVNLPLDFHIYGFTSEELTKVSSLSALSVALQKGKQIL